MATLIEDVLNLGIGLFAYSRDMIEETVEKMVESGTVAKKDASSFAAELAKKGETEREELKKLVDERISKASDAFDNRIKPVTKDEVRAIVKEEIEAYFKEKDKE